MCVCVCVCVCVHSLIIHDYSLKVFPKIIMNLHMKNINCTI